MQKTATVRLQVAAATRRAHEALHVHPVISRLIAADLSLREYQDILGAYRAFYCAVERQRAFHGLLPQLSLAPDVMRLTQDIGKAGQDRLPKIAYRSARAALGGLYVLYGARFGAMEIYRHLRSSHPEQSHRFFAQRPDKPAWQVLLSAMEHHHGQPHDIAEIAAGATETFSRFDQHLRDIASGACMACCTTCLRSRHRVDL